MEELQLSDSPDAFGTFQHYLGPLLRANQHCLRKLTLSHEAFGARLTAESGFAFPALTHVTWPLTNISSTSVSALDYLAALRAPRLYRLELSARLEAYHRLTIHLLKGRFPSLGMVTFVPVRVVDPYSGWKPADMLNGAREGARERAREALDMIRETMLAVMEQRGIQSCIYEGSY